MTQINFGDCSNLLEKCFWSGKAVIETLASVFCTVRDTSNELLNLIIIKANLIIKANVIIKANGSPHGTFVGIRKRHHVKANR